MSVPYNMHSANDTFAELLSGYIYGVYEYSGAWVQPTDVEPLYGYLVYINDSATLSFSYDTSTNQSSPSSRSLNSRNWYTIGASTRTTETASSFLNGTSYYPELHYMSGGSYSSIDSSENMVFGRGYWLYATGSTYIVGDPI